MATTAELLAKARAIVAKKNIIKQISSMDIAGVFKVKELEKMELDTLEAIKNGLIEKAAEEERSIWEQQQAMTSAAKEIREQAYAAEESTTKGLTKKEKEIIKQFSVHDLPELDWNAEQKQAIEFAAAGESFCLIGPAGTGKTSVQQGSTKKILLSNRIPPLGEGTKFLTAGNPGIVIVAFTRRARNNIRKQLPIELRGNCLTIHQLLEYEPEDVIKLDNEGNEKTIKMFKPQRNAMVPLPRGIRCIVFEESSMIGTDLYGNVVAAMKHIYQEIFLGDIQQLPPIYDSAILGYKLLELPVVELKQVYRQALESPILRLAHHMLAGKIIKPKDIPEWNTPDGKLVIKPWKKKLEEWEALETIRAWIRANIDNGTYDPEQDMILCPFNKAFGTIEINKAVQQHLGLKNNAVVYEVVAGFTKHYLAVGDRMMYEKEDCVITNIVPNARYIGPAPLTPSVNLSRHGHYLAKVSEEEEKIALESTEDIDTMLEMLANTEINDKVNQASHIITLEFAGENTSEISTTGELNALLGGNAMTVHKAQGCEWRKVFCFLHRSHAVMLRRELLYTMVTRAREELYIICEQDTFVSGVINQAIKGNTLAEKAEYFKGKQAQNRIGLKKKLEGG